MRSPWRASSGSAAPRRLAMRHKLELLAVNAERARA